MNILDLFVGELKDEQIEKLHNFQKAAEELGNVIRFGELAVLYHQNMAIEFHFDKKLRKQSVAVKQ